MGKEFGVMWPQAKERQHPPETGTGKEQVSPRASRESWPCHHLGFDTVKLISEFWPPNL